LQKLLLSSFAAAFSGISKPMFGFYIMTIGVACYKQEARSMVGRYSLMFTAVGFLTLVTHILQHYFSAMVRENAMRNLREALLSGKLSLLCHASSYFVKHYNQTHGSSILQNVFQPKYVILSPWPLTWLDFTIILSSGFNHLYHQFYP